MQFVLYKLEGGKNAFLCRIKVWSCVTQELICFSLYMAQIPLLSRIKCEIRVIKDLKCLSLKMVHKLLLRCIICVIQDLICFSLKKAQMPLLSHIKLCKI